MTTGVDPAASLELATQLVHLAASHGCTGKVMGSVAVRALCRERFPRFDEVRRPPKDIDVAVHHHQMVIFEGVLIDAGWQRLGDDLAETEGRQFRMRHPDGVELDVYGSRLDFNQSLDVTQRLSLDGPFLPAADLLLLKLQIVEKTNEDWFDLAVLLLTHTLSDAPDASAIDRARVAEVLRGYRWRLQVRATCRDLPSRARSSRWFLPRESDIISAQADELVAIANQAGGFWSRAMEPLLELLLPTSTHVSQPVGSDDTARTMSSRGRG